MSDWHFDVDSREPSNVKERAIERYIEANIVALRAADFAARVGDKYIIGFERKRLDDFVSSIDEGRLFSQIEKLHLEYPIVVLILEGDLDALYAKYNKMRLKFNEEVFWSTIASICVRDNFQILWTPRWSNTIDVAYKVSKKMVEEKWQTKRRWRPKSKSTPRDALTPVPGVTDALATKLIKKYKSIHKIAHLSEEELCSNTGVGPIIAKRIKKHLG